MVKIADARALNTVTVDMGTFQINFNEGSSEGDNSGLRDDYQLLDKITNYFPEEQEEKAPFVPLVFSALIGSLLLFYVTKVYENQANLSNITFWGFLFTLNYLVVLFVIVAFWIQVNLINTLWILLALTPVTLLTMNYGLTPESCHVSNFQKNVKSKTF